MDHVAILSKKNKILEKILSGKKTIESRWYESKRAPWGRIKEGDIIYFKESGEPVTVCAQVKKVEEFLLTPHAVLKIITRYIKELGGSHDGIVSWHKEIKNKKYGILIHIKDVKQIKPFQINKKGFGTMAAWISLDSIKKIVIHI